MTREGPREVDIELGEAEAFDRGFAAGGVVRGVEVTFVVPFEGDPWLFTCQPSSQTTVFPEGEIVGRDYRLTLQDIKLDADAMRKQLDWQIRHVEDYIRWQQDQVSAHNEALLKNMGNAMEKRRHDLERLNVDFVEALGIPERVPNPPKTQTTSPKKRTGASRKVTAPRVFICYANQDVSKALEIFECLEDAGADPWLDKKKLVHGDEWEGEIRKAVESADAFVVCLRPGFDDIGFRQKEVRWAKDALQLRPPGKGFIIPFLVEPCDLPDWCKSLHAGGDMSRPTTMEELIRAVEKHCNWRRRTGKA